jgi:hypothetical protein
VTEFPSPTPPFVTRQRLRLRTQRRNLRYWTARQLRRLVHRLDPLPRGADRHPSVVEHGYAQGRADVQLVHGHRRGHGYSSDPRPIDTLPRVPSGPAPGGRRPSIVVNVDPPRPGEVEAIRETRRRFR